MHTGSRCVPQCKEHLQQLWVGLRPFVYTRKELYSKGCLKFLQPKYLQPADFIHYSCGFLTTCCVKNNQSTMYYIYFIQKKKKINISDILELPSQQSFFLLYSQLQSTEGFLPTLDIHGICFIWYVEFAFCDRVCCSPGYPRTMTLVLKITLIYLNTMQSRLI